MPPVADAAALGQRSPQGAALVTTRPHPSHAQSFPQELSAAQRAAVTSDSRLVVVQGGPGAGKTEAAVARIVRLAIALRHDTAGVLALVTSDAKVRSFRERLARALSASGCHGSAAELTMARVVATATLRDPARSSEAWPQEVLARVTAEAGQLAPDLGLARHPEEATSLLVEMMRCVAQGGESGNGAAESGDWFRRGVALIEEAVRSAQIESLRRLRILEGKPGWIGDLGRRLRRPAEVTQRSRELRSALDRALRAGAADHAELERLRSWVDVAAIDLAEAARREGVAANARGHLWEAARKLVLELKLQLGSRSDLAARPHGESPFGTARHIVLDDAHDLGDGELERLHEVAGQASVFVTGDQRAMWHNGGGAAFRSLLREAGRAVVLFEAPRFGAGVGRFINAIGAGLWPSSEPGGYAPGVARLESDPAAAAPVELWLVRRRTARRSDGGEHPEPIGDARLREAKAVAQGVRQMLSGTRARETTVLAQDGCAREVIAEALEREGIGSDVVDVRTVDDCRGLEWSSVVVTGLDEPLGGPAPHRSWVDTDTGLAVVWPEDDSGRKVWPFSSLLLAQRAAATRDAFARQRFFLAASRARTRLVLTGVTRAKAAGGDTCIAPIEWLRRQLGVVELAGAPARGRVGEAEVGIRVVDAEPTTAM